jgi:hypothetical protein
MMPVDVLIQLFSRSFKDEARAHCAAEGLREVFPDGSRQGLRRIPVDAQIRMIPVG